MSAIASARDLEVWIAQRIVEYGSVEAATVDTSKPLSAMFLSSAYSLKLCGDIEDEFGIDLDPAIVWENHTIKRLASALGPLLVASWSASPESGPRQGPPTTRGQRTTRFARRWRERIRRAMPAGSAQHLESVD